MANALGLGAVIWHESCPRNNECDEKSKADTSHYNWRSSEQQLAWGPFALQRRLSPPPSVQLRWKRRSYLPCWQNSTLTLGTRSRSFTSFHRQRSTASTMIAVHHNSKTYDLFHPPCGQHRGPSPTNVPPFSFLKFVPKPTGRGTSNKEFTLCCLTHCYWTRTTKLHLCFSSSMVQVGLRIYQHQRIGFENVLLVTTKRMAICSCFQAAAQLFSIGQGRMKEEVVVGAIRTVSFVRTSRQIIHQKLIMTKCQTKVQICKKKNAHAILLWKPREWNA